MRMRKWLEMGENLSGEIRETTYAHCDSRLAYDLTADVSNMIVSLCVEGRPPQSKLSASWLGWDAVRAEARVAVGRCRMLYTFPHFDGKRTSKMLIRGECRRLTLARTL